MVPLAVTSALALALVRPPLPLRLLRRKVDR